MWEAHLAGSETSMNPLGMVEAVIGAMDHAASLASVKQSGDFASPEDVGHFTRSLRAALVRKAAGEEKDEPTITSTLLACNSSPPGRAAVVDNAWVHPRLISNQRNTECIN